MYITSRLALMGGQRKPGVLLRRKLRAPGYGSKSVNIKAWVKVQDVHAWIQSGDRGSRAASYSGENIGFLSNTGLDPMKFSKFSKLRQASIQCWAIIGTPVKRNSNGVSLAGR